MTKGAWVRSFAIAVAIVLLVTGQWGTLLLGAASYHLAVLTVRALERRSGAADGSRRARSGELLT